MRSLGLLPKGASRPAKPTPASQAPGSQPGQPSAPPGPTPANASTTTNGNAQPSSCSHPSEAHASPAPPSSPHRAPEQGEQLARAKSPSPVSEGARAAAAAALAAVRGGSSVRGPDKVEVTETRRFAGKDVQVRRCCGASADLGCQYTVPEARKGSST